MIKINNKDVIDNIFTQCCGVPIVEFGQVNIGWTSPVVLNEYIAGVKNNFLTQHL